MRGVGHWLGYLWVLSAVWTVLAFAVPGLTSTIAFVLMMTIVGMPVAALLQLLPTVFLYLSAGAILYLPLRRWSEIIALVTAVFVVGAVMIMTPIYANREIRQQLARVTAADGGGAQTVPIGASVAFLHQPYVDFEVKPECDEICQRLIFSGVAGAALSGDITALSGGTKLQRYWIGPAQGACPRARLSNASADDQDVGKFAPYPRPLLSSKLGAIFGDDKCFYEAPATLDSADVVLIDMWDTGADRRHIIAGRFDPRLVRIDQMNQRAVLVRGESGLKPAMRQSFAKAALLAVPLRLVAPFTFDTFQAGHWQRDATIEVGKPPAADWRALLTNDLRVGGLNGDADSSLRRTSANLGRRRRPA